MTYYPTSQFPRRQPSSFADLHTNTLFLHHVPLPSWVLVSPPPTISGYFNESNKPLLPLIPPPPHYCASMYVSASYCIQIGCWELQSTRLRVMSSPPFSSLPGCVLSDGDLDGLSQAQLSGSVSQIKIHFLFSPLLSPSLQTRFPFGLWFVLIDITCWRKHQVAPDNSHPKPKPSSPEKQACIFNWDSVCDHEPEGGRPMSFMALPSAQNEEWRPAPGGNIARSK